MESDNQDNNDDIGAVSDIQVDSVNNMNTAPDINEDSDDDANSVPVVKNDSEDDQKENTAELTVGDLPPIDDGQNVPIESAGFEEGLTEPINIAENAGVQTTTAQLDVPLPKKSTNIVVKMVAVFALLTAIGVAAYIFIINVSASTAFDDLKVTNGETYSVLLPQNWTTESDQGGVYYYEGQSLNESEAFIVISDIGYDPEVESIISLTGQEKADALETMAAIMKGLIEAGLATEFTIEETASKVVNSNYADSAIVVSFDGQIKSNSTNVQGEYLYLLQEDGTILFINVSAEDKVWANSSSQIDQIFDSFRPI